MHLVLQVIRLNLNKLFHFRIANNASVGQLLDFNLSTVIDLDIECYYNTAKAYNFLFAGDLRSVSCGVRDRTKE
jgi:hypothetical protein